MLDGRREARPGLLRSYADDLALAPAELLFIDDRPDNVEGARAAGLYAECWHHEHDAGTLEASLDRYRLGDPLTPRSTA